MIVELRPEEIKFATYIGKLRNYYAIKNNWNPYTQDKEKLEFYHIMGAKGEMAAAKKLNIYWNCDIKRGENDSTKSINADLNKNIQIRTSSYPDRGILISKKDEEKNKHNHKFISVIERNEKTYELIGWIYGYEGMKKEYLDNKRIGYAYFVPKEILKPMANFKL